MKKILVALVSLLISFPLLAQRDVLFGVYYFDGWAGNYPSDEAWAKGMPESVSYKLVTDYADRMPVWGWRDDDLSLMEKQIDLAADNGVDFFIFCWYWSDDNGPINKERIDSLPLHTGLRLFLQAKNKDRMKFAIMIANHSGFQIKGESNWCAAIDYLNSNYFCDECYLKVEGKPVLSFFLAEAVDEYIPEIIDFSKDLGLPGLYTMACNHRSTKFDINTWYSWALPQGKDHIEKEYSELTKRTKNVWYKSSEEYNITPTCIVGWDMRPWFKNENFVFYTHRTPELFYNHLCDAIDYKRRRASGNPFILVYAWNEFGEGGYLVPTVGDRNYMYLRQIKKAKKYAGRKYR